MGGGVPRTHWDFSASPPIILQITIINMIIIIRAVTLIIIIIYIYIYILSGPRKRWESFWIVSVGHMLAQWKRNGNGDGNATETATET